MVLQVFSLITEDELCPWVNPASSEGIHDHSYNVCKKILPKKGNENPNRELKQTTTTTATRTSLNKRFNEENNRCARAL